MTAARYGMTEAELMDVLSCDDDLLAMVYPHTLPRVLRFPHRVWINIRIDLGMEEDYLNLWIWIVVL